jgi:shikimate dehydrogenase
MKHFAVIGNPISHSMSPAIMQGAFRAIDLQAKYSRVLLDRYDDFELIDRLVSFAGINITAPFKKDILNIADELSPSVEKTRVTNTLVKLPNQKWSAFNTDIEGVIYPFIERWENIKGRSFLVIGAGGAARAAVVGLLSQGAGVTIVNRTQSRALELATEFSCNFMEVDQVISQFDDFDGIVNTVSVLIDAFHDFKPGEGQLLLDASYADVPFKRFYPNNDERYINGREWLIGQALEGFRAFTGKTVSPEIMRDAQLNNSIKRKTMLFLIGPMGAGKSSVGRELAHLSGYAFRDLDEIIEKRVGKSISDIFEEEGESYFRQLECEVLEEFSQKKNLIVSCGGGVVINAQNRAILEKQHSILLLIDPLTSIQRNKSGNRPLLQVDDPLGRASTLLHQRMNDYLSSAHVLVNAENSNPAKLAALIWNDFVYSNSPNELD